MIMMREKLAATALCWAAAMTRGRAQEEICSAEFIQACCSAYPSEPSDRYDCTSPGLEFVTPGRYKGTTVNYLSFVTEQSSPNLPIRAKEFEACTGGKIVFSEAANVWEDPVLDLGTTTTRGLEVYDGYFMSSSHFPEVSALNLAEHLNDRIRRDNHRLKWEDILPKVRAMGEYRKDGKTNLDFLMFDGDFFVPIVRLDLLEKHNLPLPNTFEELREYSLFFNGTDLNDDGDPNDFGLCHFPRLGAGDWDWWWTEAVYSTWATSDQTEGINQGFFFDEDTMEPRIWDGHGEGFRRAAKIWKDLWKTGGDCENTNFVDGRCAIGFAPPGCWKQVFLNGISRRDENNTIIWQPTMKSGEYAEPYRFKPFGSTEVVNRATGEMVPCTSDLCPKSEVIPKKGHHGDDDRASILPESPLAGQLINRAPFYWSGGLGTLIRRSTTETKKDLMWDFFVYANSPETSVHDVAHYESWLDSWRYSQLSPGDNFIEAGWSQKAYEEHAAIMKWALSNDVNGALNLRIPGIARYTRDVMGEEMARFISGEIQIEELEERIVVGWNGITRQQGKLHQLETYRAALGLDSHSEVELCRLHRTLMDEKDPSVCRKFDATTTRALLPSILVPVFVVMIALAACFHLDRNRRRTDCVWKIKPNELKFATPEPEVCGRGTFGLVLVAEYRGTQVAVKRVIPPKLKARASVAAVDGKKYENSTVDLETAASINTDEQSHSAYATSLDYTRSRAALQTTRPARKNGLSNLLDTVKYGDDYGRMKADFVEEMRHLSKLRHPTVTTVMGAVISKVDEPMLVLEYMDHGSLYDILHNDTIVIEGDLILPILRDIARGVRFLHAATPQVIHGDLKAQNVLVDSRFRAKITDFGLTQKKALGISGTPLWMAPEVLRGESPNTRESDAYSFGMILFEMYSRKDPYEGENLREVLRLVADPIINKRPRLPASSPPKIRTLMSECLDGEPEKRPTFEELDLQLKRLDVAKIEPGDRQRDLPKTDRTNEVLYAVFPKHVAEALREGRHIEPESRDCVSLFFSNIVGYSSISSLLTPMKVADMLKRLYDKFDDLAEEYDIFKVETIGDAYLCVTNLVKDQPDHTKRMAEFAVKAIHAANTTLIDAMNINMGYVDIRVGFHSGPVVANVVGTRSPRYGLFGDTVNTASRIESLSLPNSVLCSERSANLLRQQRTNLTLTCRGLVNLKGKGEITTYWVSNDSSLSVPKDEPQKMVDLYSIYEW